MAADRRMLWLRNVEALRSKQAVETLEAELASEAEINGVLGYADSAILCGRATFQPDAAGLHKYILKLRFPPAPSEGFDTTKEGYLFREGPVGELVALMSLQFQTRFYIASTTIGQLSDHGIPLRTEFPMLRGRFGSHIDPVLFSSNERNFCTEVAPFLDLIKSIPEKHHLRVAMAANHYARALREVGIDEEMAFVRLVSAVEVAARREPIPSDPLASRTFDEVVRTELLTAREVDELRKTFAVRRTKARFIAFLGRCSGGFFENETPGPAHTQVTAENLSIVAGAIYDARSDYLHTGTPMYLSFRLRDQPGWHMDPSVGRTWQNRRFEAEQKLPRSDFFHRLVRHCLLRYIQELAASAG